MSELTIREITKSEIPKVARFIAQVLAGGNSERYDLLYERYANQLPNRPSQLAWVYRAMFRKQQIASVIHTYDFVLRYGRASLKVVAISMLCTQSQYRHQGYASALLRYTLTYTAEQGAHLVLLNSNIDDFFPRFGFSPVWASYTLSSPTALASQLKQPHQLRIATPTDLPIMAQLYNQYWGMRVTAERPMNWWRWRMEHGRGDAAVIINAKHDIEGYIWHLADDFSSLNEVVATTPKAITSALAYSGRRWQAGGYDQLIWSVPPDDVIIPYAQQMLPTTLSATFHPTGGWMARVIDASALLRELMPEIIAQAQATNLEFNPDDLIILPTPDGIDIGLQTNPKAHAHLSLRDFIQLVFGSLRPTALAVRQHLSFDSLTLLETLFPPRVAALGAWDWI